MLNSGSSPLLYLWHQTKHITFYRPRKSIVEKWLLSIHTFWASLFVYKNVYIFGFVGPWLQHAGMEPGPPALEAWSLSHWTSREVPWYFFWQKSLCVCVCVFPGVSYTEGIIFYTLFEPCICRLVYLGAHSVLVQTTFPHAFCVVAEYSTGWRYPGLSNQSSE